MDQRHLVSSVDFAVLKSECADVLRAHSAGTLSFDRLVQEAKKLAEKHKGKLTSSETLSPELVIGLIITLAVESAG